MLFLSSQHTDTITSNANAELAQLTAATIIFTDVSRKKDCYIDLSEIEEAHEEEWILKMAPRYHLGAVFIDVNSNTA